MERRGREGARERTRDREILRDRERATEGDCCYNFARCNNFIYYSSNSKTEFYGEIFKTENSTQIFYVNGKHTGISLFFFILLLIYTWYLNP